MVAGTGTGDTLTLSIGFITKNQPKPKTVIISSGYENFLLTDFKNTLWENEKSVKHKGWGWF